MPSPVGHALGGLIVGLLKERPHPSSIRASLWTLVWLAAAANGPDLDFLWGRHRAETHSIVAALAAGLFVLPIAGRSLAIATALAWASHVLLDWLGKDTTVPSGVMALWPFTSTYYRAGTDLFDEISRRYWLPNFFSHNLMSVGKEVVLLGPIALALAWWRFRRVRVR